jgi:hypothetical protein
LTKFPKVDTRIRTPSGRFAIIESYDADDRVHVRYYDDDGGTGCFPAKLIRDSDIIPRPNTHVTADPEGGSDATIHEFRAARAVEKYR